MSTMPPLANATQEKFLSPENLVLTDLGPCLHEDGVTYRVWALGHGSVTAHIRKPGGETYRIELEPAKASGYFFGIDPRGAEGDLYTYSIDGAAPIPDFLSHSQPHGAFGPSRIVDARKFQWQAVNWVRPKWDGHVVYECHLGTFTPQGTYLAAIERLDHLVALGITALEIMPLAEWSGNRNWGYDGTFLFAPTHSYGTPDDFRALVDACHLRGLAVILDVVFNHLGPEGNFSHQYSDFYFHEGKDNPWGKNFNLDGPNSEPVRAMLRQNIRYWLEEFRIDGFRMDATHAVHDPSPIHLLAEAATIVRDHGGFIIAEDDRNERKILEPREQGGWGFDGLWSDDFHHSMRVTLTGEQQHFLRMFKGGTAELAKIVQRGWLYSGEFSEFHQKPRGTRGDDLPPRSFVFCISNHDQVGNRIQGVRLHETITPTAYRAISLFLCLVPQTPLLFQGQEWGCSSPFLYFTQMSDELGRLISEGRRREFLESGFAANASELDGLLSPQDERAFQESKLVWSEIGNGPHRQLLELYRAGLKLRRDLFGGSNPPHDQWTVAADPACLRIDYRLGARLVSVELHFNAAVIEFPKAATVLLRSNDEKFRAGEENDTPETIVVELPAEGP